MPGTARRLIIFSKPEQAKGEKMNKRTTSLLITGALSIILMASAPAGAGVIALTDAQMDGITAGQAGVSASASATAVGSHHATSVSHSDALSNAYLAYGTSMAVSYGDRGMTAAANVMLSGSGSVLGFHHSILRPANRAAW